MNTDDPREYLGRGIVRVMRNSPFYTMIILKHEVVANPYFDAYMATNGKQLIYNPNLIVKLKLDDLYEVLKHEAMHVANRHHIRMASLEKMYKSKVRELNIDFHKTFNYAADLAINSILESCNEKIWSDSQFLQGLLIPGVGDWHEFPKLESSEYYLKKIITEIEKIPEDLRKSMEPQGQGDGGEGEGEGEGEGGAGGEGQGQRKEITEVGEGTGIGDVQKAKGDLSKAEQEATEMIARASMASRGAGTECGTAKQFVMKHEAPAEVNWRTELQSFFTQIVRGRPHYRKPNRRHESRPGGIIFPSNKSREVSKIALMVDMSGSMSNESVAAAYTHITEIVKVSKSTKLILIPFDGQVFEDEVKTFDSSNCPVKENDRKRCGYGGTNFMPPIKYAEDLMPAGMIMLTDRLPSDGLAYSQYQPKTPFICLSVLKAQFGEDYAYGVAENKRIRVLEIKP